MAEINFIPLPVHHNSSQSKPAGVDREGSDKTRPSEFLERFMAQEKRGLGVSGGQERNESAHTQDIGAANDRNDVKEHVSSENSDVGQVLEYSSSKNDVEMYSLAGVSKKEPIGVEGTEYKAAQASQSENARVSALLHKSVSNWTWLAHGNFDFISKQSKLEVEGTTNFNKTLGDSFRHRQGATDSDSRAYLSNSVTTELGSRLVANPVMMTASLQKQNSIKNREILETSLVLPAKMSKDFEKQYIRYNSKSGTLVIRDFFAPREVTLSALSAMINLIEQPVKAVRINGRSNLSSIGGEYGS